jgi:tetratricopeptide (TPR) repeat protein
MLKNKRFHIWKIVFFLLLSVIAVSSADADVEQPLTFPSCSQDHWSSEWRECTLAALPFSLPSADLYYTVWWIHINYTHDYRTAIDYFTTVLKSDQSPEIYLYRASTYGWMRRHEEAIADYSTVIGLDSLSEDAYAGRAWSYLQLGRSAEALADYAQLAKLAPQDLRIYDGIAMVNFTILFDYKTALEALTMAIKLEPNTGRFYARGMTYAILGNDQLAIEDFNQAIAMGYQLSIVYYARAQAFTRLGNTQAAQADLNRATQIESNTPSP